MAAALAVFLLYTSLAGGSTPSLRPSQLAAHSGTVSLAGVVLSPLRGDAHEGGLRFRLRDINGTRSVPVVYTGSVPDLFAVGRDVSVRGHAERVVGLLDALAINYACIVGHDVGGGIGQTLAVRWPTRVSRLMLVNSVAFDMWPGREVKVARAMLPLTRHLPATWVLSIVRTDLMRGYVTSDRGAHSVDMYVRPFSSSEGRDAFMEHMMSLDSAETKAIEPRLKDIVAPTAILWGAEDPFLPVSIGRQLQREIRGSTLTIVPDARHFTPEEAPEKVAEVLAELLAR